MRHARPDYNRIQDPAGLIADDEPVFLIRGTDVAGPEAVRAWADIAKAYGASVQIVELARSHADEMAAYQQRRGFKTPDLPNEA